MISNQSTIKALLFDYGGTLDTAARHWYYVIREAYQASRLSFIPDETLRKAYVYGERTLAAHPIVQPQDDFYSLLYKKMGCELDYLCSENIVSFTNEAERELLQKELATYCDNYARRCTERSAEVLKALSTRYRLILVSNFYGNLHNVLRGYHLDTYFPTIIESAVVGVRKPDSRIWQMGVEAVGCLPEETFAIGDSYGKDIVSAGAIGCNTVWFKGEEWEEKKNDESVPTHIISHLSDLLDLF